jgi:hypothetical protein
MTGSEDCKLDVNTFKTLFPNSTRDLLEANRGLLDTVPQQNQTPALDKTETGETKSMGRIIVRFVGYRCRPLDPDNFAGGVKDLLDGLRHSKLIPGDTPEQIRLETEQVRVAKKSQERTEITLIYP